MTKINTFLKQYSALVFTVGVCSILFFSFVLSNVQARSTLSGNDTVVQEEAAVFQSAQMTFPSLSVATTGVLVDRSAVTYFQHFASGTIEVAKVEVECEATQKASTTIKVGVVTDINAAGTAQDVSYFDKFICVNNGYNATTNVVTELVSDYSPSRIRLTLSRGTTTAFITDDVELGTNNFPTAQFLRSPVVRLVNSNDTQAKFITVVERGDLVVRIVNVSGTATPTIKVWYWVNKDQQ